MQNKCPSNRLKLHITHGSEYMKHIFKHVKKLR